MADLSDFKNPFEVNDFSGGITDDIFLQMSNRYKEADNFIIKSDKTLDMRPGSEVDDLVNPQIPDGVQRVGALINYKNNDKLFVQSAKKIYYRNPSAYTNLTGPTGNNALSVGGVSNVLSWSQWNKHLYLTSDAYPQPQKIFKDSLGAYQVRSSGLPPLASDPTVTVGAPGANDYLYSFHFEYTYNADGITFQDFGPVTVVRVTASSDPGISPNTINSIPVLSNGATDNWDTTDIRVFIYRTVAGGQDSFQIGSVTNGTTTFNDNFADADIQEGLRLYIDDGTLDFDPPPLSKFVHVTNNTGYYASLKEGLELRTNIIRQSIPGDPDSVPAAFEIVVEDELTGFNSARSVPVALCKKYVYRIDQAFDQFGRGVPIPVRISDTAGCVSNRSIVQADVNSGTGGIFWFGNDGVYFSDGYQVLKVTDGNNDRYKAFLAAAARVDRIEGKFDEKERRIYWALQRDSASLDNDTIASLELRYGVSNDMPFTTWSGNSFRPTALEMFNKQLYRGDTRGFVFKHDDALETDPKVDTTESPSDWHKETIIWLFESLNYNFGSTILRKWVAKMLLTARNRGNTSIQINAINDDGRLTRELTPIRWRRNFIWGSEEFIWGALDCVWNAVGLIEQWRRFPAKGLRLSYLRLQITNAFSIILASDLAGNATFNSTLKTVTLDDVDQIWPTDSVDYFITSEFDNYQTQFQVTDRTDSTLTVLDTANKLPTGSLKWELFGYKKGEPMNLLSFNVFWDNVSQTQMTYETGDSGANS